jgi:hypothetical protein
LPRAHRRLPFSIPTVNRSAQLCALRGERQTPTWRNGNGRLLTAGDFCRGEERSCRLCRCDYCTSFNGRSAATFLKTASSWALTDDTG